MVAGRLPELPQDMVADFTQSKYESKKKREGEMKGKRTLRVKTIIFL